MACCMGRLTCTSKLAEHGKRDGADAIGGAGLGDGAADVVVGVGDRDAGFILVDAGDFYVMRDQVADLLGETTADHVHAADGLEHGGLEIIKHVEGEILREAGFVDGGAGERLGQSGRAVGAAAGVFFEAAAQRGQFGRVGIAAVQQAPGAQGGEEIVFFVGGQGVVQRALVDGLGEQARPCSR